MENNVEHELCNNCKKEIPQTNYVMHTMHCARNITLCQNCKEPVPKSQFEEHKKACEKRYVPKKPVLPPTTIEKSSYFQTRKAVEDKKAEVRKDRYLQKMDRLVDSGHSLKSQSQSNVEKPLRSTNHYEYNRPKTNNVSRSESIKENPKTKETDPASTGAVAKKPEPKPSGMLACKFCDLELPKLDLDDHENYCGSRTDKCLECGELVMFKYKQIHMDSNHGFLKLRDEPGPRPSWDSSTQRSSSLLDSPTRRRPPPLRDFAHYDYDPMPYLPAAYQAPGGGAKKKEGESYKDLSRRLDCPAPQPPASRRRNPPTELVIPCEFCGVPVPHEDLIQHETGCRPDLARFNARRRSPEPDEYFIAPTPSSPEVELPCEFCGDMIPASQLLGHQVRCT